LISISLVGITASQYFGWLTSVHKVRRRTFGEIFLPIGTLATWAICQGDPKIFVPSLLIMTFADSAAGLVSDVLKAERKLWAGSAVFMLVALVLFSTVGQLDVVHALLFGLTVTLVERFSPVGSDNTTVPVASALLLLLAL
jgi:dolichol kinase